MYKTKKLRYNIGNQKKGIPFNMNIYHALNELISYIEENLEHPIVYSKLAQFLGVNEYTLQSLFSLLCNITISDYIRKRRLSKAGFYLYKTNAKVIDIALRFQYENPTSFSRAFEKFHGMKPSQVKSNPEKLKLYPKLHFNEPIIDTIEKMEYSIIKQEELILYGKGFETTHKEIAKQVPLFFKKMYHAYDSLYGEIDYGMTVYKDTLDDRFTTNHLEYWVLYKKEIPEFSKYSIPKSKWLCFHIASHEPDSIQKMLKKFYLSFLPSCQYNIRPLPELEYYHNGSTYFLVPIED